MRRILYVSGTRADYGLMKRTLSKIAAHDQLELGLIVTGMHLDRRHGETVEEIVNDGFRIAGRIPVDFDAGKAFMGRAIADTISGCCDILENENPDLVLLLGDRGEMLAGAIAAVHLNIPVAHIHGGERSGTVDEPIRHAISKLSHFHLTATQDAGDRLVRMGEAAQHIFVVGAPGLDGLLDDNRKERSAVLSGNGLDKDARVALMVFHPVVQHPEEGAEYVRNILSALRTGGYTMIVLLPNSDLGSEAIREVLDSEKTAEDVRVFTHLAREDFLDWMSAADLMIGNSSSGIIEAASFGTPVINVGDRQKLRERNTNTIDVEPTMTSLAQGLIDAQKFDRADRTNRYGDGNSAQRIANVLADLPLDHSVLEKCCAY